MTENKAEAIERALENLDRIFLQGEEGTIYQSMLDALDKTLIKNTLKVTFGNQVKAARLLGINRNTLRAKIKKLGISISEIRA